MRQKLETKTWVPTDFAHCCIEKKKRGEGETGPVLLEDSGIDSMDCHLKKGSPFS